MPEKILPFVEDSDFLTEVRSVLDIARAARDAADERMQSNVIDPFSAIFDAAYQGISLAEWLKQEKSRQIQKSLQNAIGDFHQRLIGRIDGWESLPTGEVIDVRNKTRKIIAEIKNKHNTMNAASFKEIKRHMSGLQRREYSGYTGYIVHIIPKAGATYNKPIERGIGRLRRIDGRSFYSLATGDQDALTKVYQALPQAIGIILGGGVGKIIGSDENFFQFFRDAYPEE